jgi:glyoxylase-like metal-dependent hydrolase (beta-lactamase superfamily II)
MGAVYAAEPRAAAPHGCPESHQSQPSLASPELLCRFKQEFQARGRLQHAGIGQIYEAGTAENGFGPVPYSVTKLIEARAQGLEIAHVIETYLHADFVSGHRELAERTGAGIHVGARAHAAFPHAAVNDGDQVEFGKCRLRFLETPGHTEETLCVLVTDLERSPDPFAVLTGDTLFVVDVGRPDLSPALI